MTVRILVLYAIMFFCWSAHAADFSACEVTEIVAAGEKNAHVQLNCVVSNSPACAAGNNYVAFDKSTGEGKQYLALFMLAQAMNAKVTGWVDHQACSPWQSNVALLTHVRLRK